MGMRVLIVDDDSTTAELIAECLLLEDDIAIQTVGDAGAALRVFPSFLPQVVLLDIELPDASGLDLAGQLRALLPETRIIVLSGMSSNHGMHNLPPNVDAYLVKPVDFEVLQEHVRRAMPS